MYNIKLFIKLNPINIFYKSVIMFWLHGTEFNRLTNLQKKNPLKNLRYENKNSVASVFPANEDLSLLVHVFSGLDLLSCFTGPFLFWSLPARTEIACVIFCGQFQQKFDEIACTCVIHYTRIIYILKIFLYKNVFEKVEFLWNIYISVECVWKKIFRLTGWYWLITLIKKNAATCYWSIALFLILIALDGSFTGDIEHWLQATSVSPLWFF